MPSPVKKRATYQDVLDAPRHLVAEIVAGQLQLSPRPAQPHAMAATVLSEELGPPFRRGRGGPGGWIFLFEPELHLGPDILVPDLAGWRRSKMPIVTTTEPYFTLAPDWVCEVLSKRTARLDRAFKLPFYAAQGVGHAWLVDPIARTLEVYRNQGGQWLLLGTFEGDAKVRAEPFEVFELDLAVLWADVDLGPDTP